jgi:NTP pyrophosphatase (non-canonical NTP hydrolase)
MDFKTLREANRLRQPQFKNKKGELVHPPDKPAWTPAQWLQAVVGELGEYANLRKKVERGDLSMEEARPMLASELADVATYLDILAESVGVDLGAAVVEKWNEVSARVGSPLRIIEIAGKQAVYDVAIEMAAEAPTC